MPAYPSPEDVGHSFPRGEDMLIITVQGSASIRKFLAAPRALRGIRSFNLTHMNRGRNAYQASHCYGVADHMVDSLSIMGSLRAPRWSVVRAL